MWTQKKNNNANELLFVCTKERKKEAAPIIKTRDRTLTKNTRFNKMSERKSARRAPTPKRFSDEDVEKKPARKSTTSTTKPGGGGSKVRVFLPFRKALWKPLLFFCATNSKIFSLFLSRQCEGTCGMCRRRRRDLFSRSRTRRESLSLSLFSSLLFRWKCCR